MARTLTSPAYYVKNQRVAIRSWTRLDRSTIERWPTENLPAHWRAIGTPTGQRLQFAVDNCDKTLIGRISLRNIGMGAARIGIVMHPEYRGKGLGSEALRAFVVIGRVEGLDVLRLDVAADNVAARRCYENAGWIEIGHQDRDGHRYIEMARGVW